MRVMYALLDSSQQGQPVQEEIRICRKSWPRAPPIWVDSESPPPKKRLDPRPLRAPASPRTSWTEDLGRVRRASTERDSGGAASRTDFLVEAATEPGTPPTTCASPSSSSATSSSRSTAKTCRLPPAAPARATLIPSPDPKTPGRTAPSSTTPTPSTAPMRYGRHLRQSRSRRRARAQTGRPPTWVAGRGAGRHRAQGRT